MINRLNELFQNILKPILPSLYSDLTLAIYSRENMDDDWTMESGSEIKESHVQITEYPPSSQAQIEQKKTQDSREKQWEHPKYLTWKIYASAEMPNQPLLKNFLCAFLKECADGFIDCKMFEGIHNNDETVLKHLFSNVANQEYFLRKYIDAVLSCNCLLQKTFFTQLSAQMYEKRPMHGSIRFLSQEKWAELRTSAAETAFLNLEHVSCEQKTFEIENLRMLRKLLEMNTEGTYMLAVLEPKPIVAGIAAKNAASDLEQSLKECAQIVFRGYLKWDFYIGGVPWFSCDNGTYKLCLEPDPEKKYRQELECLHLDNEDTIIKIITMLAGANHGTSIVFMDKGVISKEIDRLRDKNRMIELSTPTANKEACGFDIIPYLEHIKGITSIDGALLADLDGNIYAIGTILDGEAVCAGETSRGARYNSVKNYVALKKNAYPAACIFGIVVSEDGDIRIILPASSLPPAR